jgi:hypothetical protein
VELRRFNQAAPADHYRRGLGALRLRRCGACRRRRRRNERERNEDDPEANPVAQQRTFYFLLLLRALTKPNLAPKPARAQESPPPMSPGLRPARPGPLPDRPADEAPLAQARELFQSMGYKPRLAQTETLLGQTAAAAS